MKQEGTASAVPFFLLESPPPTQGQVSSPSQPGEAWQFSLELEASEIKQIPPLRFAPVGMTSLFRIPYSRLIKAATYPAPNPLSIFTTLTFEAQEFIIPKSAARPLNAAP